MGTASGPPGVQVEVPVTLSNGGGVVVATSNDIVFDDSQVDVPLVGGVPDCTINPAIGPGTAVDKALVAGFAPGSVPGAKVLRVGIAAVPPASPNANPIPDGELFRCRFDILPGASLGTKVLANTPDASDASGNPVPVGGTDGAIEVALPTSTPTDTPTPGPTDTPTQTPTVTDTPTITQTPTVTNTPEPGAAFCGNGVVDPGEECDDGGACFGGTAAGNLCVSQAECPGGECRGFGGDGCAANCTVETVVTYEFAGAECVAGARDGESCSFAASCVGGTKPGRPCTKDSDCGSGGTCVSECGTDSSGCFGLGECTSGPNVGADCFTGSSATGSAVRFGKCEGGTNPGALCLGSAECPGGSCVLRCIGGTKDGQLCPFGDIQCPGGTCGTDPCGGGECLPKTRASLEADFGVSAINVGPLIGSQQVHVGKPDGDGMVPVAVPASSVVFAPVKVPGITCACVRGVEDAAAHGPGNSSSGEIACGAVGVANGITLAQDHNTSLPNTCLSGPSAGSPCVSDADCGGSAVGRCNSVASGEPSNGPGQCVGGTNDGRACQTNAQCVGGGTCTGLGQGGGFCMGPPKYCVGGTNDGFACFNDAECPGGTCPGVGNFLGYCDEDADCPGSRCVAPDDAACVAVEPPLPVGTGDEACLEQEEVCTAGPNAGLPCTQDTDCGTDGQCATECNPQAKASHRGVCNSPAVLGVTGSPLAGGHAVVLQTTQIGTLDDIGTCSFAGKCVGGSTPGVDCVVDADCGGGGVCASATCSGGTNPGGACTSDADCPGGGTCVPNNPTKGLDGLPCTDDDPPISRGVPSTVPGTTGRALALVADANANAGGQIVHRRCTGRGAACRTAIDGVPFDCAALLGSPASVSGTRLTVAFTALDQQTGDWAVLTVLTAR
ncbi:MAG: hypothetical protein KatS3mg076_1648 [Candidatus Binatia bacterium]|nr:MAG: hypothetical protein KatS3mg076_1648 [Candidatus Binatia bacterium]